MSKLEMAFTCTIAQSRKYQIESFGYDCRLGSFAKAIFTKYEAPIASKALVSLAFHARLQNPEAKLCNLGTLTPRANLWQFWSLLNLLYQLFLLQIELDTFDMFAFSQRRVIANI